MTKCLMCIYMYIYKQLLSALLLAHTLDRQLDFRAAGIPRIQHSGPSHAGIGPSMLRSHLLNHKLVPTGMDGSRG